MANIIDISYFHGDLELPIDSGTTGVSYQLTEANSQRLQDAIGRYEREYLRRFLGVDLYDAMIEGLAEVPIGPKWTTLRDKFIVDSELKLSPIANYVYANYLYVNEISISHKASATIPKAENQQVVSNYRKIKRAISEMVAWNLEIAGWLLKQDMYDLSDFYYPILFSSPSTIFPAYTFKLFETENYGI